jgi:hypothetical protein
LNREERCNFCERFGAREEPAAYAYEDEDQSVPAGLKPGLKVRHPQFGEGVVLSVEPLDDDSQGRRPLQFGGAENAAGEVCEAGGGVTAVMNQGWGPGARCIVTTSIRSIT